MCMPARAGHGGSSDPVYRHNRACQSIQSQLIECTALSVPDGLTENSRWSTRAAAPTFIH
jgi:hypothetical protein